MEVDTTNSYKDIVKENQFSEAKLVILIDFIKMRLLNQIKKGILRIVSKLIVWKKFTN